ncbi:MAG: hypothetical protein ACLVJ7_15270 [Acutalibacteraceae bacterium]
MIYSQAAAAHIYIGVAIILAILVTSILGVVLSIILNLRSNQHAKNHRAVHPKGNKNRPAHPMSPKYITIHDTGNASKGAGAKITRSMRGAA